MAITADVILTKFCERFDGREKEMVNPLILWGELRMIANELGISIESVAMVIKEQLDRISEEK